MYYSCGSSDECIACRPGSPDGICDPTEECNGDPGVDCLGVADAPCPADFVEPVTTLCGDGSTTECTDPDTCDGLGECLLFHNKPCGSATSSSLCEFDMEPAKGDCSTDGSACLFDLSCAGSGGVTCTSAGHCLDALGENLGTCTPDVKNWPACKGKPGKMTCK